jgi:glycolate oxidase iron-sulfur subunit
MHLLASELAAAPSARFREIFARCLLCGACEQVCSRNLPITELVIRARSRFPELYGPHPLQKKAVRTALAHPVLLKHLVRAGLTLRRLGRLPPGSGLRLKLGLLEQEHSLSDSSPVAQPGSGREIHYFSGCLARYVLPSIARATAALARASGFDLHLIAAQGCCGLAAQAAGRPEEARELAWRNIRAFAGTGGPILTSCASCSSHLRRYGELFAGDPEREEAARAFAGRVHEFSAFFVEQASLSFASATVQTVFYHDPCHLRCTRAGREAPRQLLDRVAHLKRVEPVDGPRCCGQGGLFHIGYPHLGARIFKGCLDAALAGSPPDLVTTTCTGCLLQWRAGVQERGLRVRVAHLAVLLAERLRG